MKMSVVKNKLAKSQPVHAFGLNIPHGMLVEMFGAEGFDCLWFDQEHFPTSLETTFGLIQACRGTGADAVLRVAKQELSIAAKALDMGVQGICYPRCESVDEVADLMRWLYFPPLGDRGVATGVAAAGYNKASVTEFTKNARECTFAIVQIETRQALDEVEEIASLPGVDILFVGPTDLSLALGINPDPHSPDMLECIKRIGRAAKQHGKHWGMPALSAEHASELTDLGALFIVHGSDTSCLRKMMTEIQENFRKVGFTYRFDGDT